MEDALRLVYVVHGTWSGKRRSSIDWRSADGEFSQRLVSELNNKGIINELHLFDWSGRNSAVDRSFAASALATELGKAADRPNLAEIVLIGHSHGGNICIEAAEIFDFSGPTLKVVCIATPYLSFRNDAGLVGVSTLIAKSLAGSVAIPVSTLLGGALALFFPESSIWLLQVLVCYSFMLIFWIFVSSFLFQLMSGKSTSDPMPELEGQLIKFSEFIEWSDIEIPAKSVGGASIECLILRVRGDEVSITLGAISFCAQVLRFFGYPIFGLGYLFYIPIAFLPLHSALNGGMLEASASIFSGLTRLVVVLSNPSDNRFPEAAIIAAILLLPFFGFIVAISISMLHGLFSRELFWGSFGYFLTLKPTPTIKENTKVVVLDPSERPSKLRHSLYHHEHCVVEISIWAQEMQLSRGQ